MRTDELIDLVVRDTGAQAESTPGMRAVPLLLAALFSFAALWLSLGPRADLSTALFTWPVAIKFTIALAVLMFTLPRLPALFHPETRVRPIARLLIVPAMFVAMLLIGRLISIPAVSWVDAARGSTLLACLVSIPLFALPMLAATLFALRQGAPSDPRRAGQIVGAIAGASSMIFYSLHCIEDDPAFFSLWYSAGVVIVTWLGGVLGQRVLRW